MGDAAAGAWSMPTCAPFAPPRWRARRASVARPLCSRASGRSAPRPLRWAKPELKRREACPQGTSGAERHLERPQGGIPIAPCDSVSAFLSPDRF